MASSETPRLARYRASQFFAALKAHLPAWAGGVRGDLSRSDAALVKSILPTAPQQRLFTRMSLNDQRHALAVAHTLQRANFTDPALMQAALLHDVAKSMGQPIIHRVLIVLLEAFWPSALRWLSTPTDPPLTPPVYGGGIRGGWLPANGGETRERWLSVNEWRIGGWRRPFVIHAHHPALGAAWAEAAGCEPLAVRLIARHQEVSTIEPVEEEDSLLAVLKWADDLN